ncbi:ankyrin repeat-containing domain protein, partial [Tuber borchii]
AARDGYESIVKILLDDPRVDVNAANPDGDECTPLHLAVSYAQDGVLKLLLADERVEAESKDKGGKTPLDLAVERGHEVCVKLL